MSFRFKNFFVNDSNTSMKVGIDGVVIGAYARLNKKYSILDVGAGSGIISLILAQRYSEAFITAIELHAEAFGDCKNNFANSPWHNRLELVNADFLFHDFGKKFDAIVSNPPFFDANNFDSFNGRLLARNNKLLPLNSFLKKSASILMNGGDLILIYPYIQRKKLIEEAFMAGFYLNNELKIRDNDKSEFKRSVLHFTKLMETATVDVKSISLKDSNGSFSSDFSKLTKALYL